MVGGEKVGKCGMGFWICSVLVIGNMVGLGVFLFFFSLVVFGGFSLFGWLVLSIGVVLLVLIFVCLVWVNFGVGGFYVYICDGFGSFVGYLCVWIYWKVVWIGNVVIVVILVGYLWVFILVLVDLLLMVSVVIVVIWLCILINL